MIAVDFPKCNSFGPIRRQRLVDRSVRLSSSCGAPRLPTRWSPKDDADRIVRMREELEPLKLVVEVPHGCFTLR